MACPCLKLDALEIKTAMYEANTYISKNILLCSLNVFKAQSNPLGQSA